MPDFPYQVKHLDISQMYLGIVTKDKTLSLSLLTPELLAELIVSLVTILMVVSCMLCCISYTSESQMAPLSNLNLKMREIMRNDFKGELNM